MIGKIIIGKSFRGCINYCLDKKEAEVLDYNFCYGNKKELIQQFNDVRNLNPKLAKPVQHMTISLANGEWLSNADFISVAQDCATEIGFDKNQYIVIAHHDTAHQHIHIIVNRIGLDGKTLKDSNNYQLMAAFCRKMELKYNLQKVLSPRCFLSKELRHLPRTDSRKEKLRNDIKECLAKSEDYSGFEILIKQRGYQIEKARGIAFTDIKNVRIKGSEVGYSLATIEKLLAQKIYQQNTLLPKKSQVPDQKKTQLLPKKQSKILLLKSKSSTDNIADILAEKTPFIENVNQQYKKKKKRGQRL